MVARNPNNVQPKCKDKFYVYELRKPNNEVFYVGKGKGRRINQHFEPNHLKRKSHKNSIIKKYGSSIKRCIIAYFDNEDDAYALEEWLISFYKIKDDGGKLTNILKSKNEISEKCRNLATTRMKGHGGNKGCSVEQTIEIYKMYFTDCLSKEEISKRTGLSYEIIRSRLIGERRNELYKKYVLGGLIKKNREYENETHTKYNPDRELMKKLRDRWIAGEYLSVLCKEVGCCVSTLKRMFTGKIRYGMFDDYEGLPVKTRRRKNG